MCSRNDIVMSLAHDVEPNVFGQPGFDFQEPIMTPFRVALNTPLVSGWPTFSSSADSLKLLPATAAILDDMRNLLHLVLSLPIHTSDEDLEKVKAMAEWVGRRLMERPESLTTPGSSEQLRSPPLSPGSDDARDQSDPGSSSTQPAPHRPWIVEDTRDEMYRCIRMTAKVYCRAILNRTPTSAACSELDFLNIWSAFWRTGQPNWESVLGIFIWVMVGIMPSCHATKQARFIKSLMMAGFMSMCVENWHFAIDAVNAALRLQRWLAHDTRPKADDPEQGISGSQHIVDKYGFPIKDHLPRLEVDDD